MELGNQELVDVALLKEHPRNPRRGNIEIIVDSLREHGQYQPIGVQRSTGHVVYGNHRLRAARDVLGWKEIAVQWIDCDDEQALKILLMDNRSSDLGRTDGRALAGILEELGSFDGSGYRRDDLDSLLSKLSPPPSLPKFDDDDAEPEEDGGAYKLAFASLDDRKRWVEQLRKLADRMPDVPLASNRVMAAIEEYLA